ncbi:glycosyltransferase [Dyella koreensis]|uniref:Glycosyltransferase n=1 Tax=Dyella koreensis TaxID=311235 RepID=A0ABW8K6E6_9GAMM
MKFTGERFIPTEQGEIRLEHFHRYALARGLVAGKDVLDVACGEGYGSSILASQARSVVGVDISNEAVDHARATYGDASNLEFRQGSAAALDLPDNAFDVVVSFETVEHLFEQEEMLAELRRVLRPSGILLMSSPNRPIYSDAAGHHNEYHVKELDFIEFDALLKTQFPKIQYWGQRLAVGSAVLPLEGESDALRSFLDNGKDVRTASPKIDAPVYYMALCANDAVTLPSLGSSMYFLSDFDLLKEYHSYANWTMELVRELKHMNEQYARVEAEQARIIVWATGLNDTVLARDAEIARMNDLVEHNQAMIDDLGAALGKAEALAEGERAAERENRAALLEGMLSNLETSLQERNDLLEANNKRIDELGNALGVVTTERDRHFAALNKLLKERSDAAHGNDMLIAQLRSRLTESEHERERVIQWSRDLNAGIEDRDRQLASLGARRLVRLSGAIDRMRTRTRSVFAMLKAGPKAIFHYGSFLKAISHALRVVRRDGVGGLHQKAILLEQRYGRAAASAQSAVDDMGLYQIVQDAALGYQPKVSVIVPNFNHGPYLRDRLESIYKQSYKNIEIILLDDCSTDNSRDILTEYAERYPDVTVSSFNVINSGGVFNQWKKGLRLATGELIWIAESDDYVTLNFLEELVRDFANPAVMLSFCRTDFVSGEACERIWTTEEYLGEFGVSTWASPFVRSAHRLVNEMWATKNIVPNVSSAVFRHPGHMDLLDDPEWMNLRLCGDWVFYLSVARGGLVSYRPTATNFYRQHQANTSVNAQKDDVYYREHEIVARRLMSMYKVDEEPLRKQREQLYQHWTKTRGSDSESRFKELYSLERIEGACELRKPNVVMVVYSLAAGGGETLPLTLANILKEKGYAVTVLNCAQAATEIGVRSMLSSSIPLLELPRLELVEAVGKDMGIELVHSHHAWVDVTLSFLLAHSPNVRQVVTTHGMYEMLDAEHLKGHLPILDERVDRFVYTAEKNLAAFSEEFRKRKKFVRIDNALARSPIRPVAREELDIAEGDFVLCMVARAIPEKGWEEAIAAVTRANEVSARTVHLLLIGQGAESDRLSAGTVPPFIHFLGFKKNIRDYFSMADLGFLPSRFRGESFPLVLIDCLYAGKPLLASNIGEIKGMLGVGDGMAGEVFDLNDWNIEVESLAKQIAQLANDSDRYMKLATHVHAAAEKFDPDTMCERYEAVYRSCVGFQDQSFHVK